MYKTYHPGFLKCYGRKSRFIVGNTERLVAILFVPVSRMRRRPCTGAAKTRKYETGNVEADKLGAQCALKPQLKTCRQLSSIHWTLNPDDAKELRPGVTSLRRENGHPQFVSTAIWDVLK